MVQQLAVGPQRALLVVLVLHALHEEGWVQVLLHLRGNVNVLGMEGGQFAAVEPGW